MMTALSSRHIGAAVVGSALMLLTSAPATAQTAPARYAETQEREGTARRALEGAGTDAAAASPAIAAVREVISAYEAIVRRYPVSGYCDNALLNAAALSDMLYQKFAQERDRTAALRLYRRVAAEYPTSSLIKQSQGAIARLESSAGGAATVAAESKPAEARPTSMGSPAGPRARLTSIDRTVLPNTVRVTIALDREVSYYEETLDRPARVFFDLKGVDIAANLADGTLRYPTDIVRQIRIGRHPNSTVRVVLDLEGVRRHSVYTLYNPYRVVIDCESPTPTTAANTAAAIVTPTLPPAAPARTVIADPPPVIMSVMPPAPAPISAPPPPAVPAPAAPPGPSTPAPVTAPVPVPEAPNANVAGGFSLSRQLGLGISRVVIDPGHGGHDPGAQARGLNEAELTLDVALRLEKLLQAEPGLEVVLTRRTNDYIPLEERTAIANRESADLFLSIHANASRSAAARGVETYFLSFAATPEAEAVAARENSAHAGEMHNLPDIIKAIALNNKLDESRDLAGMVQEALVTRLRRSNSTVRNLGVKKAPFVVLIGAGMPSVLAEVSFITNKQELQLLKTPAYKQRIAEALHAAVLRYRRSLKGASTVALQ
jgi:N-acetylmuramoyl-L-alanine amidase